ncbi:RNA ligase [Armatimonas sp.]|uniref:RNA ligase n=1 Tax=Armatimonas sp. TaxID=1872638 RepID=UPI00374D0654
MNRAALLTKLNKSGFLTHAAESDRVLVHPARSKYEWAEDELRFRSAVLDADGNLVSVGWPKFFNQGEWPAHDTVIAQELASGRAVITHKHDGSLLIRSVLSDGQILLRTRGSYDGGEYGRAAEVVAKAKYPALLDPTLFPHGSLLFEYVGKANQIVVRYEGEDDLIFLGAVVHEPFRYFSFAELKPLALQLGLRLVETYDWAKTGAINEVLSLVQDWNHAEGVVVRSGDGQTLLKIKSAWYFAQHALRWHMTYDSIVRFILDGGITDEVGLEAGLAKAGWDFEIIVKAKEHFALYKQRRTEAEALKAATEAIIAGFNGSGITYEDERERRKAFAALIFLQHAPLAKYAFILYDGKTELLESVLLKKIIYQR